MNGIKLKPQSQKDNIEKELEFEIIQKLNNRGINFIQNLKMFNGTFKVNIYSKKYQCHFYSLISGSQKDKKSDGTIIYLKILYEKDQVLSILSQILN